MYGFSFISIRVSVRKIHNAGHEWQRRWTETKASKMFLETGNFRHFGVHAIFIKVKCRASCFESLSFWRFIKATKKKKSIPFLMDFNQRCRCLQHPICVFGEKVRSHRHHLSPSRSAELKYAALWMKVNLRCYSFHITRKNTSEACVGIGQTIVGLTWNGLNGE